MTRVASVGGVRRRSVVAAALITGACATLPPADVAPPETDIPVPGTAEARRTPELPPIPHADGPLSLEVGYPPENATVAVRDSNFIFGSTGSGRTQLTINGAPIQVAPNGGFLAFIPVPADGLYRLEAVRNGETASFERRVRVPPAPAPAPALAITAPAPVGVMALRAGETFEVAFRGPPGARAAVLLPDGRRIELAEQVAPPEAAPGEQFRTDVAVQPRPTTVRYAGLVTVTGPVIARDTALARPSIGALDVVPVRDGARPAGVVPPRDAILELAAGSDTVRTPLRLTVAVLPADVPRVGIVTPPPNPPSDWTIRGRVDVAGPFHYFWPAGTRLTITGERDGMYRVRLAGNRTAWVPVGDVRLMPAGASPAWGVVNAIRFNPQPEFIDLRIPLPERMPYQVIVEESALHIDVFGAVSRINFFQHGGLDPLMTRAQWSQPADSVLRISMEFARPVWGYHTWYDQAGGLVLRIRRPPVIDPVAPLRGLVIAVDPGHGGEDRATRGPTGLTEADANLYISLQLRELLEASGARVFITRTTDTTVALGDRPRLITESGAHVSVSVHNNAFPDGVNPWVNAGTSVYYYHPHSADLARHMQAQLLDELGLRDIGYGRADLALVRPTWMPAVLTETMFMMIPEQEAALRDPAVQRRIAEAHVRALEAFLRARSGN